MGEASFADPASAGAGVVGSSMFAFKRENHCRTAVAMPPGREIIVVTARNCYSMLTQYTGEAL